MKTWKKVAHRLCISVGVIAYFICAIGAALMDISQYRILLAPAIVSAVAMSAGLLVKKSAWRMCGTYETMAWLTSMVTFVILLTLT